MIFITIKWAPLAIQGDIGEVTNRPIGVMGTVKTIGEPSGR